MTCVDHFETSPAAGKHLVIVMIDLREVTRKRLIWECLLGREFPAQLLSLDDDDVECLLFLRFLSFFFLGLLCNCEKKSALILIDADVKQLSWGIFQPPHLCRREAHFKVTSLKVKDYK